MDFRKVVYENTEKKKNVHFTTKIYIYIYIYIWVTDIMSFILYIF